MSSNWSEKHEQVIEKCLESKETFRTYLTSTEHPGNVRCAFLAFTGLVNLFSESINKREKLEEKVKELGHAKSCMEGALTYVKDQLRQLPCLLIFLLLLWLPWPLTQSDTRHF